MLKKTYSPWAVIESERESKLDRQELGRSMKEEKDETTQKRGKPTYTCSCTAGGHG